MFKYLLTFSQLSQNTCFLLKTVFFPGCFFLWLFFSNFKKIFSFLSLHHLHAWENTWKANQKRLCEPPYSHCFPGSKPNQSVIKSSSSVLFPNCQWMIQLMTGLKSGEGKTLHCKNKLWCLLLLYSSSWNKVVNLTSLLKICSWNCLITCGRLNLNNMYGKCVIPFVLLGRVSVMRGKMFKLPAFFTYPDLITIWLLSCIQNKSKT